MRLPKYGYSRGFEYVKFIHGQELDPGYFGHDECYLSPDDFLEEGSAKGIDPNVVATMKEEMKGLLANRQNWRSDADHQVARVSMHAARYLEEEVDPSRPFFLWVDSFDPHEPYDPPSVWDYSDHGCPYDPGYKGKDQIVQFPGLVGDRYTEVELKHIRSLYAEKVTLVDKWVGKLLDRIHWLGLWDNTLIILCSDHGKPLGNGEHGHGLMRMFRPWPYEYMVHTPLLVRMPGQGGGKRIKSYTQSCDIAPTILDWLGLLDKGAEVGKGFDLKSPLNASEMQGRSLLPHITGFVEKPRDFAIGGIMVLPGPL